MDRFSEVSQIFPHFALKSCHPVFTLCGEPCWYRCCSFFKSKIRKDHLFVMKIYDYFIYIICSLCLNFFHLLARKLNLQKIIIFIQTNSFIIIYWSKSSFTCPGLWASGLAWRQDLLKTHHNVCVCVWLWEVSVFNATFNNISATCSYRGDQFYWWMKPEYSEKTTDLLQVNE